VSGAVTIRDVLPGEIDDVRALLRMYSSEPCFEVIGDELRARCFIGFDKELEGLPGLWLAGGTGALLVAVVEDEILGCVGLKRLSALDCEMKRLFVRPGGRGEGVGARLVSSVLERGRALGYRRILLNTLPTMVAARALYRSFGFVPTAPYRSHPVPGAEFYGLELVRTRAAERALDAEAPMSSADGSTHMSRGPQ
jgi:putative acetyltransferase